MQIAIGALLAAAIAFAAHRTRTLDASGAFAAFSVGTIVFGIGGWSAAAVLLAFFAPSVALSRVGRARKKALRDTGKQGARDAWQVLANGGVAALCILLAPRGGSIYLAAFAGAFAAAAADTWGTEMGTLARQAPRSILTWRQIPTGLSGGITLTGTLATIAGACCVALVARYANVAAFVPVAIAGVAGGFADSLLGASVQALRHCPACDCDCETNPHHCGTATTLRRGAAWIENDAINVAATVCGALVAGLLAARALAM
jgi:uncharacterized protein (TIGR00297 family)